MNIDPHRDGRDLRPPLGVMLHDLGLTRPVDTVGRVKIPEAPKSVVSFDLAPDLDIHRSMASVMDELFAKIKAEDERLRRLLPAPPKGYSWHAELMADQAFDWGGLHGDTTYRLRYRLKEDPDAGRFGA